MHTDITGYCWARDEFGDTILIFVNEDSTGKIVKDMTKEKVYNSLENIEIISKINLPTEEDYDNSKGFTSSKLKLLYLGIISALLISALLTLIVPETILSHVIFFNTNITTITNVVIMLITIGLWKWKLFAEEKAAPATNAAIEYLDRLEEAGLTISKVSELNPIFIAFAEGVGSLERDEICLIADYIRKMFDNLDYIKNGDDMGLDESPEEMLNNWERGV